MQSMAPESLFWRIRRRLKAALPSPARRAIQTMRSAIDRPALERVVLHDYATVSDPADVPRLNLVIPTIHPDLAFGGITTALDLFIRLGVSTGADMRILLDDWGARPDRSVVDRIAAKQNIAPQRIEVVARTTEIPRISVRARDVFIAYNWWVTLNLQPLVSAQKALLGRQLPYLYIYQEFEPGFYPFSTTHQLAWQATRGTGEWWAIYNSRQLVDFLRALGLTPSEYFVIEPRLSPSLRPLRDNAVAKERIILVYGRQSIPRNCYAAVEAGLRQWAATYPDAASWQLVSAGASHAPVQLPGGLTLKSVGKLSLEDYAALLNRSAVGLSLMSSPHPSYPPLEMAHFGLLTVTNNYSFKSLSAAHDNMRTVDDIRPDSIAAALADACDTFAADRSVGHRGVSHMDGYIDGPTFPFLDELTDKLAAIWENGASA